MPKKIGYKKKKPLEELVVPGIKRKYLEPATIEAAAAWCRALASWLCSPGSKGASANLHLKMLQSLCIFNCFCLHTFTDVSVALA